MACHQLIQTLRCISSHPGGHRGRALWRHLLWQLRRNWHRYPYEIAITPNSKIVIANRVAANGCAALAWSLGRYDYDNMAFLQDLLTRSSSPKVLLDIGANVGIYSLLASEESGTRVFAFEPHPATAALLARNIEANGRQNVTVERCALSSAKGSLHLTDQPGSPLNHLVGDSPQGALPVISIPTLRADDYCRTHGLTPQFLKIDVEGHEADVLQGLGALLHSVQMIILEENLSPELLHAYLPAAKFSPFYIDFNARTLRETAGQQPRDLVFIHTGYLPEVISLGYRIEGNRPPQL